MAKDNSINKLLNFFGIAVTKPAKNIQTSTNKQSTIAPGKKNDNGGKVLPINFPTDIQNAYQYFLSNYSLYNSNAERINRYRSLEFFSRNDGIGASACQIYTEETYEAKDGVRPIQIKAKDRKVEKDFYSWLDSIGFNNNILRELSWNLTVYGDSFWLNSIDLEKGVVGITVIDPYLIKDKIEFNLNAVNNIKEWETTTRNLTNKYRSLQQIADLIQDESKQDDYSLYYKSYLLGYELKFSTENEDSFKAVPPWAITHFRHFSTKSEFFPFGRPLFINSLARFKSYRTTEMLIDMLRVASFPKEHIKVICGDTLTPLDRRIRVNETREMIENMSPVTNTKDNMTIGDRIYSVEGLFEFEVLDPNIDIGSLGDLEMKMNDLILSTGIPDSYLIPSRGSGMSGENAQALYYNNKIFQRRVEGNKSALLEGLTFTYRMHLELANKFDGEKTEFELFMPVNAEMYSGEKISNDSEMLRLATDMMNNLGQALGMDRGESLPEPVVRDIYKQYLPLDDDLIDKWIDKIVKKTEEEAEVPEPVASGSPFGASTEDPTSIAEPLIVKKSSKFESAKKASIKKFVEGYYKGTQDELIREAYFKSKKELGMTNGLIGKYLYYNNTIQILEDCKKNGYKYDTFSVLREYKNELNSKRLQENEE